MDRFDAMQAFARVVEVGSFTKAAETLQMSKTSVTQLVQQLEARLRVKLLNRTTRKVNVTPDGAVFYERVVRLLTDLEDAETSLSSEQVAHRGTLRVDVPSPLASMIVVPALPDFYAKYPGIRLHLGVSDRLVDLIDENVDCVIRGGEVTNLSLVARHIADLSLAVYAAPTYLAQAGHPENPAELGLPHHRIVGYSWSRTGSVLSRFMQYDGQRIDVKARPALVVDDGNAYLTAGLAGLGALWLPTYMAQPYVLNGRLIPLFSNWKLDPMPLYLAFPQSRYVSAKLRVFIDWIVELMAQHFPIASSPSFRASR